MVIHLRKRVDCFRFCRQIAIAEGGKQRLTIAVIFQQLVAAASECLYKARDPRVAITRSNFCDIACFPEFSSDRTICWLQTQMEGRCTDTAVIQTRAQGKTP